MNILFVCTGNTCRSPMAEAIFRNMTKGLAVEIRSAGVAAADGLAASENARLVLEERGISHAHQSSRLTGELVQWADIVLTMTRVHKDLVTARFPEAKDKVFTLKEYAEVEGDPDIADPFGGDLTVYQSCAGELDGALNPLLEKIRPRL